MRTCAIWKAMAPGPYGELAHKFFAPLMTCRMVLLGSPAGSPSVIEMTWGRKYKMSGAAPCDAFALY